MYDRYGRDIRCLRVSVTAACNLRCSYCVPDEDSAPAETGRGRNRRGPLSFDETCLVAREAVRLGITKIRLTGGEPLLRPRIEELVSGLKDIAGLEHVAMTTNGVLLERSAPRLSSAGLDSVNVSLDTLSAARYAEITGGASIEAVLRGIAAVRREGIPTKINMVVQPDGHADEIERMRAFCAEQGAALQLIERYDLRATKLSNARYDRPHTCERCDRIRLIADGTLKPCLHSNLEVSVDFADVGKSLRECIELKPKRGGVCTNRRMVEIGG